MPTKIGVYVDADGMYVGDVLDDSPLDETLTLVTVEVPEGFHHPKWDGAAWVEGKSDTELLAIAQAAKIAELDAKYSQATAYVQSSALGTAHTYVIRDGDKDYSNFFNSQFAFVQTARYNGNPFMWFTAEEGDVSHTRDQFEQVYADIHDFTQNARTQRKSYEDQINACLTPADVANIAITF